MDHLIFILTLSHLFYKYNTNENISITVKTIFEILSRSINPKKLF